MKYITELFSSKGFCALLLWCSSPLLFADQYQSAIKNLTVHSKALSKAPMLPRQQILRSSRVSNVKLSPDGTMLLYATRIGALEKKLTKYWLYHIGSQSHIPLFTSREVNQISWSANSQALFMEINSGIAVSHLKKNTAPIQLIALDHKKRERWLGIDLFARDSFYYRAWDVVKEHFQIKRVSASGAITSIYQTKTDYDVLAIGLNGKPLIAKKLNQANGNQGEQLIFDLTESKPREIWRCHWNETCAVLDYQPNTGTLLLKSNQYSDLTQIVSINLATKAHSVLHADPLAFADISHVSFQQASNGSRTPALVEYHGDQHKAYAINNSLKPHLSLIEKTLSAHDILFSLPSDPESIMLRHWLIRQVSNDAAETEYYLYRPETKQITRVLDNVTSKLHQKEPLITANAIAPKSAFRYLARDGFELQGYLTLPRGVDPAKAPMVVSVHGGPWSRVTNGFDRRTQHLANRGYIVFQPNFRASTGFGKAYLTGTNNDFGDGTAQNDIIDGVHFLLNNHIGDRQRLAIVGHSFGGFSTLAGLTFTPELFQVGFAGAPPTTMGRSAKYYFRFKEKLRKTHNDYFMKQLVVDWDDELAFEALHKRSPDYHFEKMAKPLVIWAGQYDRRVFITDVQDYSLRLSELSKPVTLFVDPKALHSPNSRLGRRAYTYLMELTLARYLGGHVEPLNPKKDKALIRFIKRNMKIDSNQLIE